MIAGCSLPRALFRSLVHAMAIGLAGISLGCGAPRDASSSSEPEATPTERFSIESVHVGIGFDEQVLVDESARSTQSAPWSSSVGGPGEARGNAFRQS